MIIFTVFSKKSKLFKEFFKILVPFYLFRIFSHFCIYSNSTVLLYELPLLFDLPFPMLDSTICQNPSLKALPK